jgi:hypothetical protein
MFGEEEPKESVLEFVDSSPSGRPSARFQGRLKQLGRRRKRFAGRKITPHAVSVIATLIVGGILTPLGVILALAIPGASAAVRWILIVLSLLILGFTLFFAWWLWARHQQYRTEDCPALDFHENGGVFDDTERLYAFTWTAVRKVVFSPDSTPGETSRLAISLGGEEWVAGQAVDVQILHNALVLTSQYWGLDELHKIARRLHEILGDPRVVARSRDGKRYKLD